MMRFFKNVFFQLQLPFYSCWKIFVADFYSLVNCFLWNDSSAPRKNLQKKPCSRQDGHATEVIHFQFHDIWYKSPWKSLEPIHGVIQISRQYILSYFWALPTSCHQKYTRPLHPPHWVKTLQQTFQRIFNPFSMYTYNFTCVGFFGQWPFSAWHMH